MLALIGKLNRMHAIEDDDRLAEGGWGRLWRTERLFQEEG
jgi:hypothetical protein